MNIRQNLVSSKKYNYLCPYSMKPTYITIHNTDNDASADNEVKNVINNSKQTGFHVAVDNKEAVQAIPFNRNAWHAGDGSDGKGNRQSIAIEICYSKSGGNRFYKAVDNAVIVVADLAKKYNIPVKNIVQHNHWSGKNCPARIRQEGLWDKFIKDVESAMKPQPTKPVFKVGPCNKVYTTTDNLNVRAGRGTEHKILGTLKKGTKVKVLYVHRDNVDGKGNKDLWGSIDYGKSVGYIHLDFVK